MQIVLLVFLTHHFCGWITCKKWAFYHFNDTYCQFVSLSSCMLGCWIEQNSLVNEKWGQILSLESFAVAQCQNSWTESNKKCVFTNTVWPMSDDELCENWRCASFLYSCQSVHLRSSSEKKVSFALHDYFMFYSPFEHQLRLNKLRLSGNFDRSSVWHYQISSADTKQPKDCANRTELVEILLNLWNLYGLFMWP